MKRGWTVVSGEKSFHDQKKQLDVVLPHHVVTRSNNSLFMKESKSIYDQNVANELQQ